MHLSVIARKLMLTTAYRMAFALVAFAGPIGVHGAEGFSVNAGNPNVIAEEGAWCWFADPRALHHSSADGKINKSYIGYIDIHGNIKATQQDFNTGERVDVLIRSWFQPDDHNNPTFLVLPDDRIVVFYSRHTDEPCFYYRVTRMPADLTTLGEEKRIATENNTTYPSPFILSDDPEHIYLCWRGINWHPTIARLTLPDATDSVAVDWGPYQLVQSTGARPYAKYQSNGKDRIMVAYTTGHPDNELPNYLYFNYIDINKKQLLDIGGQALCDIADGPLKVNKDKEYLDANRNLVVDMPPQERDWLWQVVTDKENRPVIATVRISADKSDHKYYLSKWDGSKWRKSFIAGAGGHFHQSPNLEKCYTAGMVIDPDSTDVVYCSVPRIGRFGERYEIVKYRLDADGNVSDSMAITSNSAYNNVRPYILPGSSTSPLRLVWMYGDYFDWIVSGERPLAFNTSIMGDSQLPSPVYMYPSANEIMPGQAYSFKSGEDFALSAVIRTDVADGVMLRLGDLEYRLNPETHKPEIRLDGNIYSSTNTLATSDSWRSVRRATDGRWHKPIIPENVNLRIVYSNGVLSTYINGILDQRIKL